MNLIKRLKREFVLALGVSLALLISGQPSQGSPTKVLHPPDAPIPITLFGMHILHRFVSPYTTWPAIPFGDWRFWDTYTGWASLEPNKSRWDYAPLDKYVELAEQHHVNILLTLGVTPSWASTRPGERSGFSAGNAAEPTNLADWQEYVRVIATRYKGRIHDYEIWNEPNAKGFYSGSIPEMVQLASIAYRTLKQVDPTITVTSPSATEAEGLSWFDSYLKAGGGKYADVIAYHLYVNPAPPEEIVPLIQRVEQIMRDDGVGDKPLWDTETGYMIQNKQSVVTPQARSGYNSVVLTEDEAAAYVARTYILAWAAGVSRLYWYAWDNWVSGLVDRDGKTLKSPAIAYGEIEKWLVGARMDSCASDSNGTWTCSITREGGYRGWIMWNPTAGRRPIEFQLPASWRVRSERDLLGHVSNPAPGSRVEISIMPHLFEAPAN